MTAPQAASTQADMPAKPHLDLQADLPEVAPALDLGVICSGLCDSPEAQARFDAEEAGKPPVAQQQQSAKVPAGDLPRL